MAEQLRVGFIGIGKMGNPISKKILNAGFPVTVLDVRPEAVAELVSLGASEAATPKEMTEVSDVLITSLPTHAAHIGVYFGENGIMEGVQAGQVLVETSTISPSAARHVAEEAAKHGAGFLDGGLLSSTLPSRAAAAAAHDTKPGERGTSVTEGSTSTIMVGGDPDHFEKARPVLETFGDPVVLMGPAGSGMMIKVLNNGIVHAYFAVLCEAFAVGKKAGLDLRGLYNILTHTSSLSSPLTRQVQSYLESGEGRGMSTEAGVKDSAAMLEIGAELNVPMMMQAANYAYFQMAMQAGQADKDPWNGTTLKLFEEFIGARITFD